MDRLDVFSPSRDFNDKSRFVKAAKEQISLFVILNFEQKKIELQVGITICRIS